MRILQLFILAVLAAAPRFQTADSPNIQPCLSTERVTDDPDDPAVYVDRQHPGRSLILGTNKSPAPSGALVVFGLDGKIRQSVGNLDRPNNVDVEYGFILGGRPVAIAVVTERLKRRLRVFQIGQEGILTDISSLDGLALFKNEVGEHGAPMGVGLYRRPRDGAVFAIVSPKTGPREGYLGQYLLSDDGSGKVKATEIRRFGRFSGKAEIEAIAVDDALGYVYYADEGDGIHKYAADPGDPRAATELAHFGREGFKADREGIAVFACDDGTGYILTTDQVARNSRYNIYRREGTPENPHDHSELLKTVSGGADATDGIEATSAFLGPEFPNGIMIAMNSGPRNFLIFRWEDIADAGPSKLKRSCQLAF